MKTQKTRAEQINGGDIMGNVDVKWKYAAIILGILFILETLAIVGVFKMGMDSIDNEMLCSTECVNEGGTAYVYDDYYGVCSCYDSWENLVYTEKIK